MNIDPCMWCKPPSDGKTDCFTDIYTKDWFVSCYRCKCEGPKRVNRKQAIEAWNEIARIVREAKEKDNA